MGQSLERGVRQLRRSRNTLWRRTSSLSREQHLKSTLLSVTRHFLVDNTQTREKKKKKGGQTIRRGSNSYWRNRIGGIISNNKGDYLISVFTFFYAGFPGLSVLRCISCGWHCRCDFSCLPLGGAVVKLCRTTFVPSFFSSSVASQTTFIHCVCN